jgi:hypothetical protein
LEELIYNNEKHRKKLYLDMNLHTELLHFIILLLLSKNVCTCHRKNILEFLITNHGRGKRGRKREESEGRTNICCGILEIFGISLGILEIFGISLGIL